MSLMVLEVFVQLLLLQLLLQLLLLQLRVLSKLPSGIVIKGSPMKGLSKAFQRPCKRPFKGFSKGFGRYLEDPQDDQKNLLKQR